MTGPHAHRQTSYLAPEDLSVLRDALVREKEAVKAQYHEDVQAARDVREEGGEDLEELAALDVDRELLYAMSEADLEKVEEIEDALQRMDEGTYGLCQTGGEPIALARLRQIPWARYCIVHQARIEELESGNGNGPWPSFPTEP